MESKQSTLTQQTSKQCSTDGLPLPEGHRAEGCIVTMWNESVGELGQHGVITRIELVDMRDYLDPSRNFTGNLYTICKCTPDGTINGGLVQLTDRDWLRWTGDKFYDTEIPFDDGIPF